MRSCDIYTLGYTLEQAQELVEILNTVIQQSVASEIGNCVKTVSLVRMSLILMYLITYLSLHQDKMVLSLRGDIDNVRYCKPLYGGHVGQC